jgi:hypothetical protein
MSSTTVLNSGRFELSFFDRDDKIIELRAIACSEYKLYTDNGNTYLYVKLTSPLTLIDPKFFNETFSLKINFVNEEEETISAYKFNVHEITWELNGQQGMNLPPTWQVIYALSGSEVITK